MIEDRRYSVVRYINFRNTVKPHGQRRRCLKSCRARSATLHHDVPSQNSVALGFNAPARTYHTPFKNYQNAQLTSSVSLAWLHDARSAWRRNRTINRKPFGLPTVLRASTADKRRDQVCRGMRVSEGAVSVAKDALLR